MDELEQLWAAEDAAGAVLREHILTGFAVSRGDDLTGAIGKASVDPSSAEYQARHAELQEALDEARQASRARERDILRY